MLELLYTSNKTVTVPGSAPDFMAYINYWDALVLFNSVNYPTKRLDKIFRDGTQCQLGTYPLGNYRGARENGRLFWLISGVCYGADEMIAQPNYNEILNPDWTIPSVLRRSGDYLDDRRGLYLHALLETGKSCIDVYRLSDGVLLYRALELAGKPGFTGLAPAGGSRLLGYNAASGYLALVDYVGNRLLWESSAGPCLLAAYDTLHNLVMTLGTDHKIRIYLLTAVPAVLSAPEFYPAVAEADRYVGYPVRTRLLGADGEPCAGYRVDWLQPLVGTLEKAQSLTDAEGYAGNYYYATDPGAVTLAVEAPI